MEEDTTVPYTFILKVVMDHSNYFEKVNAYLNCRDGKQSHLQGFAVKCSNVGGVGLV